MSARYALCTLSVLLAAAGLLALRRWPAPAALSSVAAPGAGPAAPTATPPAASPPTAPASSRPHESAPSSSPPPSADGTNARAHAMARFADPALPIETRMAEIDRLAASADADAIAMLKALGDADTYLNVAAVEALGRVGGAEVAAYLAAMTSARDPRLVCAAVWGLARAQGAAAIPLIGAVLERNRLRPDGYQDTVCAACVEALRSIGSPAAVPLLAAELEQTAGFSLNHDYGSSVVAALGALGDPAAIAALDAYARRLEGRRAEARDNPLGHVYYDTKLAELQNVRGELAAATTRK